MNPKQKDELESIYRKYPMLRFFTKDTLATLHTRLSKAERESEDYMRAIDKLMMIMNGIPQQ
jgi:hypothetical protein